MRFLSKKFIIWKRIFTMSKLNFSMGSLRVTGGLCPIYVYVREKATKKWVYETVLFECFYPFHFHAAIAHCLWFRRSVPYQFYLQFLFFISLQRASVERMNYAICLKGLWLMWKEEPLNHSNPAPFIVHIFIKLIFAVK